MDSVSSSSTSVEQSRSTIAPIRLSTSTGSVTKRTTFEERQSTLPTENSHPFQKQARRRREAAKGLPQIQRRRGIIQTKAPPIDLKAYVVDHQISKLHLQKFKTYLAYTISGLSSILLLLLGTIHFLAPANSNLYETTRKFYAVSHYNPETGLYGKGLDDVLIVSFWIVMFTFIRAVMMDFVFIPYARYSGIPRKGSIRFGEQAWSFVYATVFWTLGMVSYNQH